MPETIITPLTPSTDEYGIVAAFSESTLDRIEEIQKILTDRLGDGIWLTPRQALHSTLMEIICDTEYQGASRQQLFKAWYESYNTSISDTIANFSPCVITFTKLEVSHRAIILRTGYSNDFNTYRAALLSNTQLPAGTKLPPDITHCSLARFSKVLDFDFVTEQIHDLNVSISERIGSFALLRDLGPPTFTPKTIETYGMDGPNEN